MVISVGVLDNSSVPRTRISVSNRLAIYKDGGTPKMVKVSGVVRGRDSPHRWKNGNAGRMKFDIIKNLRNLIRFRTLQTWGHSTCTGRSAPSISLKDF